MSDRCDCCGEFEHLKRIDSLVDVLKAALPTLVVEAVNALKPELPKLVPNLSDAEWETLKRDEDWRRERAKPLMIVRRTHREWGSRRIELGRLWLIRCAPGHPNRWMIVWRTGLPEWDSQTKWEGSDKPGRYWKGCDARLQRKRGVDPEDAICRFPRRVQGDAVILPAQEIRSRCASSAPMISPFVERDVVRGMSFGLSAASYDVRIAESVTLDPGEFVLASTMERFCIPNDVLIVVHDKSSWARRGLAVQNTIFDPGWRGYATLELTNYGRETLTILRGDPIAQVVCHLLTEPTTQPYGFNGTGKYQNQEPGPQGARDEKIR